MLGRRVQAGSLTAVVSAVGIGWLLGASRESLLSLAPKSVTTPIAMGIAEKLGGLPSLTAVLVVATGIVGAVLARGTLNLLRIQDHAVRGFAVGVGRAGDGPERPPYRVPVSAPGKTLGRMSAAAQPAITPSTFASMSNTS